MFEKYVLLDVENPNIRGNSICAIAVIMVENDAVVDKKYSLINPEDRFDAYNSSITGIDASKIQDAPTFKVYWNEIRDIIENNIIVGHNVAYDLNVLSKSLDRYDIEHSTFKYCCTLQLSRKYIDADSYKLESLVAPLQYTYDAHNALSDALAAGRLFQHIKKENSVGEDDVREFGYIEKTNDNTDERLIKNLNILKGIIEGIVYDGVVNDKEIVHLKKWVDENTLYKQYTLFAKIINELSKILEDNKVDEYEQEKLKCLVMEYSSSRIYSETTLALQVLQGIVEGISCDKVILESEIYKLNSWLDEHDYLAGVYPYDKIVKVIKEVLADGKISESEKQSLLGVFEEIVNPLSVSNSEREIEFNGKTFCLSGEFAFASKSQVSKMLQEKGAIEKSSVSSKVDYLIVGGEGNAVWKFGKIGGKIAKALELQEKGCGIRILMEEEIRGG